MYLSVLISEGNVLSVTCPDALCKKSGQIQPLEVHVYGKYYSENRTVWPFILLELSRVMMFNDTFNNISVILWQSVLLVEESGENHWPAWSNGQALSYNVSSTPHHEQDSNSQL